MSTDHWTVRDACMIASDRQTVFTYLTQPELLALWWPVHCEGLEEHVYQFTWSDGSNVRIVMEDVTMPESLHFDFYHEHCSIKLSKVSDERTEISVVHDRIPRNCEDPRELIHIAQSWSQLLRGLKATIEHGIDLRDI